MMYPHAKYLFDHLCYLLNDMKQQDLELFNARAIVRKSPGKKQPFSMRLEKKTCGEWYVSQTHIFQNAVEKSPKDIENRHS